MTQQNFVAKQQSVQVLSHRLRQSLHVLHMSALKLEEEIGRWLADNPMLERLDNEEGPWGEGWSDNYTRPRALKSTETDDDTWHGIAAEENFYHYLHQQAAMLKVDEETAAHVHILIDSLDEKGYLSDTLEEIIDNTPLEWQLTLPKMQVALDLLQSLEPAGVGARDLSQSLWLQLQRFGQTLKQSNDPQESLNNAKRLQVILCAQHLIKQHLGQWRSQLGKQRILEALPASLYNHLEGAIELIGQLSPYPAQGYAGREPTTYIQPDVLVKKGKGGLEFQFTQIAQPRIQLNPEYLALLSKSGGANPEIKQKISEARIYVDALKSRESTLTRLTRWILDKQEDFFTYGNIGLVPLTIKETAEALSLSESTVSRAVNQKYLQCAKGLFAFRYFFTKPVAKSDYNEAGSSRAAIQSVLSGIIEREDKTKPLSDASLVTLLKKQGISIARRTVAKYREELGIPPLSQRRRKA